MARVEIRTRAGLRAEVLTTLTTKTRRTIRMAMGATVMKVRLRMRTMVTISVTRAHF